MTSIKSANVARKTTATNSPKAETVAPKALAPKVETKAPATKVAPKAPAVEYSTLEQTKALADMVRGLYARIESVETENAVLRGQCDVLGKVIVGIQLSFAQATVPSVAPKAPAVDTPKVADPTPKAPAVVAPKALAPASYKTLISECVDSVIEGINNGTYSEKVIPQCDNDLRAYMTLAMRKAVKAFRTANDGYTLKGISEDIVRAFEEATDSKAASFAK